MFLVDRLFLGGLEFPCDTAATMIQTVLNRSEQLLSVHYSGHVDAAEMEACLHEVSKLLEDVEPGLRVLADLSGLESMDADCAPVLGAIMDLLVVKRIASVVRVVPDPQKDIGFGVISHFHYGREVHIMTVNNLDEAIKHLAT